MRQSSPLVDFAQGIMHRNRLNAASGAVCQSYAGISFVIRVESVRCVSELLASSGTPANFKTQFFRMLRGFSARVITVAVSIKVL